MTHERDEATPDPKPAPHDDDASEPLGPLTPDDETELGDSPELHDEISPHDLPKGHAGRAQAERDAQDSESGTTGGNR
jgi:hypothetical protein